MHEPHELDETFVRLRRGFRGHLPYFASCSPALFVYLHALMASDYRSGTFQGDHEVLSEATALTPRQVRRALCWLSHGRGCPCARCRALGPMDRPRYLERIREAGRGRPAVYLVLRGDHLSRIERELEKRGQLRLVLPREAMR